MEVYSRNTADIIRYDFLKFSRQSSAAKAPAKTDTITEENKLRESFDQLRTEMANDDGRGSYGTYKCPIF